MENVSALTTAIELLNKQSDGLLTSFGRLAESSKTWNIVSRLLSGSGLWQLQNRIRAIGNIMNLYNINLASSLKNQMDAVSSAKQMADAISGLKAEQDNLMNSEYFDALERGLVNQGYDEATASLMAHMEITEKYENAISALQQKQAKLGKGGIGNIAAYMKYGDVAQRDAESGGQTMQESQKFGSFFKESMKYQKASAILAYKNLRQFFTVKKFLELGVTVRTWMKTKLKTFGRFLEVGLTLFVSFAKYLLIATLIIALLRGVWPQFKKLLELGPGISKFVSNIIDGLKTIFYGVVDIVKGVFEGNFTKVFKGLGKVLFGIAKVLLNALVGLLQIVVSAIIAIPVGIAKAIGGKFKSLFGFKAVGGPARGLTVVGERGPELVNLPAGSRVHSNADSRRMAGNTINVHVAGRIGASDAEIKDIANKVAREINMRMNRTSSTVSRF